MGNDIIHYILQSELNIIRIQWEMNMFIKCCCTTHARMQPEHDAHKVLVKCRDQRL